jgi:(p)ppGpp synthase/HD superfamily hydrolase
MHAQDFAISRHYGQTYGSIYSYEYHLNQVVSNLVRYNYTDPKYIQAGWLHDVIEDTETTITELQMHFGHEVADMVWALTGIGETRSDRTSNTIEKLIKCPAAIPVKMADRLANMTFSTYERQYGRKNMLDKYSRELKLYQPLFEATNQQMYDDIARLALFAKE